MIRDTFKSEEYFIGYLQDNEQDINNLVNNLKLGEVAEKAIPFAYYSLYIMRLNRLIVKYSLGEDISSLKEEFLSLLEEWLNGYLYDELSHDETYGPYSNNIIIFSLCVLFNVNETYMEKVRKRLKEEKINDWLINFIMNPHIPKEAIMGKLYYKKTYIDLQTLILLTDKENQKEFFEQYVSKIWYRKYRACNFWGSHNKDEYFYRGYWAFEAAAVAKILGIDDSSLKGFKYYPYDLVHYNSN